MPRLLGVVCCGELWRLVLGWRGVNAGWFGDFD